MRNYEVTFIVDPVLSSEEIDATASGYKKHLTSQGCKIVHFDAMGLRQLAYPINKRTSGIYFCIEFETEDLEVITRMELALRRDERIMRFLTVKLDKYGVKYNDDKRNGLIGKGRKDAEAAAAAEAEPVAAVAQPVPAVAPVAAKPVEAAPAKEEAAPVAAEAEADTAASSEEE